jgi:patatin-like phospholipase/acyl hydrolase
MEVPDRFSILSLDGGGLRGIFSAALLAALEEDLKINIVDHFDMIAGTSTGGIIAMGLGLGLKPQEILNFYIENASVIFPKWRRLLPIGLLVVPKYQNTGLINCAKKIFEDKKVGDSKTRLVITSYSLTSDNVYLFRTAHHERLRRDYRVEAWKVCAATSAAPGYFPAFRGLDQDRLVDGGIWANNPSMVALTESLGTLDIPLDKTWLCSVGTTSNRTSYSSLLNRGTKLPWAPKVPSLFLNAQRALAENQSEFFLKDRYQRINFIYGGPEMDLDSAKKIDDLFAAARSEARRVSPIFAAKFAATKANKFIPIHNPGVN